MKSLRTSYLNSFTNYELRSFSKSDSRFNLTRVKRLLADLGCPEKQYPVIHVVGTKGKGSTCAFLASMLQSSGLKVGLYTSPHLYDLTERIRILMPGKVSGKEAGIFEGKISSRKLEEILRKVKPKIEHLRRQRGFGDFTFFEVLTAVAFYFFAEQNVDVVVAEAGLGGRLDATNVGNSEICVFAPISYDHTQILGSTLKHIAQEKAAVIKASTKVIFSAPQKKEVRFVIEKNAKKYGLKVFYVGRDIQYKIISQNTLAETFSLKGLDHTWPRLKSPLLGEHQVVNASLAAGVVEYFLKAHSLLLNQAVVCGVAKTRWLGRFEILRVNPFVVIDSAHNEDSAKKLAETVAQIFPKRKVIILFGASRDKDIKGILKWLKVISPEIILTRAAHPRSCDFSKEKIKQLQLEGFLITKNVREGFKAALQKSKKGNVILAAGSIFLAGEIRKLCMPKA